MFDRALRIYFKPSSPLSLPKTQNYIQSLNTRQIDTLGRYRTAPGKESQGVVLLRHVIAFALRSGILNFTNDYDRYSKCLLAIHNDLDRIFDPVTTGVIREELFIHKNVNATVEIVIPVHMEDYLKYLPFNRPWREWQDVRALRLLDIDSNELTYHTFQDVIKFKNDYPSRAIFAVDTLALVMQYCNFVSQRDPDQSMSIQEYLHQYVLFPLLEDLQNIWLRNRYIQLLETPDIFKDRRQHVIDSMYHNIYGFIGTQYPRMIEEVYDLYKRSSQGSTVPEKIMASLPLSKGYIPEYVQSLSVLTTVTDIRQNEWVEYLRDLPWLKLCYLIYRLNTEFVGYTTFYREFQRDISLVLSRRFWSNIHNSTLRSQVESEVKNIASWVNIN
jgi:hypothetical protein